MRSAIREWIARLNGVLGRSRSDADLQQEIQTHLDMLAEDLRRGGMSPADAAREARVRAGRSTQTIEALRDRRGIPPLSSFWLDLKLGARMLRKSWGLTLVGGVAMVMAITLGASVFAVVQMFAGTSVPLEEGSRLVIIQPFDPAAREGRTSSQSDLERWGRLRTVEQIGAYRTVRRNLVALGDSRGVLVAEMTASGFETARVAPLQGRYLLAEDEAAGAAPALVLGFDAWKSVFSGDPDVVGKGASLDGVLHTIVGVMPQGFAFPVNHQYWTTLNTRVAGPPVTVFARLVPGATLQIAHDEVRSIGISDQTVAAAKGRRLEPRVVPYVMGVSGERDNALGFVPLLLPLLLVPACANMAILMYARIVTRQGEFAARSALGAGRMRIVGQVFAEVLVLAAGAAGLALLLAPKVSAFLFTNMTPDLDRIPFWMRLGLSYATIGYTALLALVAAFIAGAIPAWRATGRWQLAGLHVLGQRSAPKLGVVWNGLVVAQVALAVAIIPTGAEFAWAMSGAGLRDLRFAPDEYVSTRVTPAPNADPARFALLRNELLRQISARPDVVSVTLAASLPSQEEHVNIEVEGTGLTETAAHNRVDLAYFKTFHARVLTGREFEAGDLGPGRNVAVVNRDFARRMLGEGNPLGRRIRMLPDGAWLEIVGVIEDFSPDGGVRTFYQPLDESAAGPLSLAVQTDPRHPPGVAGRIRQIATSLGPGILVSPPRPMFFESFWIEDETLSSALGALMLVVLVLSVTGVYTLMAFVVAQRRREIGIRSALGAAPGRLIAGVFRRALIPVAAAAGLGGFAAVLLDFYYAPLLFDFREGGRPLPWILSAAELFIVAVALLALSGPARRALRIDPVEALRDG
jgi:putative ABC transport system permease protein